MGELLKNFSLERMLSSLQYMWKGMLSIFIVIGVLVLFVFLLNLISNRSSKEKETKE